MLPRPIVLGYHGCQRALAGQVVAGEKSLKFSSNDYDWLGHGVYFWADDSKRAAEWVGQSGISEVGVVGAVIDLGNCLQLAKRECLEYLREAHQTLEAICCQRNLPMPQNTGRFFGNRKLDCAVFETLHRLRDNRRLPPFDTVAAYFVEGEELYPGAAVRTLDHVQICVRNPARILGYFLPRDI
ncbi:MAG: hypothetical protein HYY24_25730 [Verrucomicrobia bacterium]|nr:hypothetical protein [Verrucomicrobiota bacterium]